jgi:hypothetical protein
MERKTFKYQQNNNTFWTLEDASYDPETGKVTGRCVEHTIINRLFHASSWTKGYDHGKDDVSIPPTGHKIEPWMWENGYGEHSWCG